MTAGFRRRFVTTADATIFAMPGHLGPRCGRVLRGGRHERGGEYADPDNPPVCGRPAGHAPAPNGSPGCRSEAAVARDLRAGAERRWRARMRAAA